MWPRAFSSGNAREVGKGAPNSAGGAQMGKGEEGKRGSKVKSFSIPHFSFFILGERRPRGMMNAE